MIEVAEVPVGLTTCYDVRFPGLYAQLGELGAEVIVVAASWGAGPGKVEQWQLLTRARALDSTAYLVEQRRPTRRRPGSRCREVRRWGSASASRSGRPERVANPSVPNPGCWSSIWI